MQPGQPLCWVAEWILVQSREHGTLLGQCEPVSTNRAGGLSKTRIPIPPAEGE